jgi:enterochelin esterase-like enzyme
MNKIFFLFYICLNTINNYAQIQMPSVGKIERLQISFTTIPQRPIDVWLPNNYNATTKYNVLYMQDGQMLFDTTHTWNHQEWKIDETMQELINAKKIPPTIVVAIHNIPRIRYAEYVPRNIVLPSNIVSLFIKKLNDSTNANEYLKFIVQKVKPMIDKKYNTFTDSKHTFIAGSSMGGLLSMYAVCEYPSVFGGAICMSTHWPGGDPKNIELSAAMFVAFKNYIQSHQKKITKNKFYFDYGTQTLDSFYAPYQQQIDILFTNKQKQGKYFSKQFVGDAHNEMSWANRMHIPLEWMIR